MSATERTVEDRLLLVKHRLAVIEALFSLMSGAECVEPLSDEAAAGCEQIVQEAIDEIDALKDGMPGAIVTKSVSELKRREFEERPQ